MKSISTRNYQKHYILHLLPTVTTHDDAAYVATVNEASLWHNWLRKTIRHLITDPVLAKNMMLRADQLKKYGGLVASLQTIYIPINKEQISPLLVQLDLNYNTTKEVQVMLGGLDVTHTVATSDKLTGLLTRLMKEIHTGYEMENWGDSTNAFIEELFVVDDVDMVIDEHNRFKVQVAPSLRDYLVALNSRLRVNA